MMLNSGVLLVVVSGQDGRYWLTDWLERMLSTSVAVDCGAGTCFPGVGRKERGEAAATTTASSQSTRQEKKTEEQYDEPSFCPRSIKRAPTSRLSRSGGRRDTRVNTKYYKSHRILLRRHINWQLQRRGRPLKESRLLPHHQNRSTDRTRVTICS